jgi:hypothetical protein
MNNENIKNLIKKVENLLKEDDRFIDNGDNIFKQHIKRIYKESKHNRKPIDISLLTQPIRYITKEVPSKEVLPKEVLPKEVPSKEPIEELKLINTQLKNENDELKEELDNRISQQRPDKPAKVIPQSSIQLDFSELHQKLNALDIENMNAQLDQVSRTLGELNKL